jgi:hypothetical protein
MRRPRNAAFALLTAIPLLAAAATAPTAAAPTPTAAPSATAANTVRLEDLTVMALGALDGRAVLKTPDGKLQVLKVGDTIPGTHAVLSQVLANKIVVQETIVGPDKAAKTQTVWISKSTQPGAKSAVQRMDSVAPAGKVVQGQVMKTVPAPGTDTNKAK